MPPKPTHRITVKPVRRIFRGERWTFDVRRISNGEVVVPPERYHRRVDAVETVAELADAVFEVVVLDS